MAHIPNESAQNRPYWQAAILVFEGLVLLSMTIAFWYDNSIRPQWFWLLWLAVPIFGLRLALLGRLWTHTLLHSVLLIFIVLAAFNYPHALYRKESFLAAMARPLLGFWTFTFFVALTRLSKNLKQGLVLLLGMSFCLAVIALTTSQWLPEKTSILWYVIEYMPRVDYREFARQFDFQICSPLIGLIHSDSCFNPSFLIDRGLFSFNVNEIAGALVTVAPILLGIAVMVPMRNGESDDIRRDKGWLVIRLIAALIFGMMFIALLFGQSRFAIAGLLVSLTLLAFVAIPNGVWRYLALGLIGLFILLQASIFLNVFTPMSNINEDALVGVSERDENSVATRLTMWQRSLMMMRDYPLTGVGMYMFRTAIAQDAYLIPYFAEQGRTPPHAHNEWFNMLAEMGLPGIVIYLAMQFVVLRMLWYGWTQGNQLIRMLALATFAGLLARAIYGLGDTIALWDRFHFVLWWVIGLAGAQYVLARLQYHAALEEVGVETI